MYSPGQSCLLSGGSYPSICQGCAAFHCSTMSRESLVGILPFLLFTGQPCLIEQTPTNPFRT